MFTSSYTSILLQLKYLSFFAGICFPAISIDTIKASPRASIHTAQGSAEQIHHPLRVNLTADVQACGHASKPVSLTKVPHVLMWSSFFSDWSSPGLCQPGHLCLHSQVGKDMLFHESQRQTQALTVQFGWKSGTSQTSIQKFCWSEVSNEVPETPQVYKEVFFRSHGTPQLL